MTKTISNTIGALFKSAESLLLKSYELVLSHSDRSSVVYFLIGFCLSWWIFHKFQRKTLCKEITENGYVTLGGEYEHRLVAEWGLDRRLQPREVVHHINGIKTDNRESNLCVLDRYAHDEFHEWIRWKVEVDGRYPPRRYQRAVLRDRYRGILLRTYQNEIPPLDEDFDSNKKEKAS